MIAVTPQQMKKLEAEADSSGVSYAELMERAGSALADNMLGMLETAPSRRVLFLCGSGNNAGDCFVAASKLYEKNIDCTVFLLCGMPSSDLAKENFKRIYEITAVCDHEAILKLVGSEKYGLIADGIFGTGFHGDISDDISEVLEKIKENNPDSKYIAVDVPSGGNSLTGAVSNHTLKADATVTFGFIKTGMTQYPLKSYCGHIECADIGLPKECKDAVRITDTEFIKRVIPKKSPDSHKGNYGRLLTVCGSERMPGACIMSLEAAAKSGAGLVEAAAVKPICGQITSRLPEAMLCPLDADSEGFMGEWNYDIIMNFSKYASAVLIGCGIGMSESTKNLVKRLICDISCPIILDADGINCITDSIDIIKQNRSGIILTPHPAEMGRLCGKDTSEIQADRIGTARDLAKKYNAVVVLKGAGTVIASSEKVFVNTTGNPGMAKGGSGDVLSGIIASLTAQGINIFESAAAGAYIHGLAGDIAADALTMQCMTATDIIKYLPDVFRKIV